MEKVSQPQATMTERPQATDISYLIEYYLWILISLIFEPIDIDLLKAGQSAPKTETEETEVASTNQTCTFARKETEINIYKVLRVSSDHPVN